MKVSDVLATLATRHLQNLSMSQDDDNPGTIRPSNVAGVVGYMNDVLTMLYTRFNLKEREAIILQYKTITQYHLDKRYAMYNPDRPAGNIPYILDLPAEQFNDDCLKVLSITNDIGAQVPLNDNSRGDSFFTPNMTTIQIPAPLDQKPISVIYQAKHEELLGSQTDADVYVPSALVPAFYSMIASMVCRDMNTQEMQAVADRLQAFYETECARHETVTGDASIHGTSSQIEKFEIRGFC